MSGFVPNLLFAGPVVLIVGALSVARFFRSRAKWARETLERMGGTAGLEYSFSPEYCAFKSPVLEARQPWRALWGYRETADAFLIFPMKQAVNVVPRRAFSSEDQAHLRELLSGISPNRPPNAGPLLDRQTLWQMAIVGLTVSMVYVYISMQLTMRRFDEPAEKSNRIVRSTVFSVERWRRRNAPTDCPTTEQLIQAHELDRRQTNDGWGRAVQMTCQGAHFSVRSAGADGHFGTADDIVASDADLRRE